MMSAPQKASEVDCFPYVWPGKVCYFRAVPGPEGAVPVLEQIRTRDDLRQAVRSVVSGLSDAPLYAAWPGSWRTDLFRIDQPERLAEALDIDTSLPPG